MLQYLFDRNVIGMKNKKMRVNKKNKIKLIIFLFYFKKDIKKIYNKYVIYIKKIYKIYLF